MRSGYVALVGRPNVGKSTLLNAFAGQDVSIITPKPETTRERIIAVVPHTDSQIVFVDTPGIHRPHQRLGEYMNAEAREGARNADVVVMLADATEGHVGPSRDKIVTDVLAGIGRPVILALNKVDAIRSKNTLLPLLETYAKLLEFDEVIPISAATGHGLPALLDACAKRLPEGQALFPADQLTDRSERYLAAERIREALIFETGEEIPYVTAVEIERWDEKAPKTVISATIHVERPGQKKIVIGTGGERIRAIGQRARHAIERMLGRAVFLELWVKVTPEWTRSAEALARFGYATPKGSRSEARKR